MGDLEWVKKSLENAGKEVLATSSLSSIPSKFYESFILHGLKVDAVEPGRLLCSLKVPPRLLNTGNFLHGGATASLVDLVGSAAFYTAGAKTAGSPLEIGIAYLDAAFAEERKRDQPRRRKCWEIVVHMTFKPRRNMCRRSWGR